MDIKTALITVMISLITTIVNAIITCIRDNIAFSEAKKMKVIDYKIQAYRKIYSALLDYRDYFYLFIGYGNEYKECEESSKFAPLEKNEKLRKVYNRNVLYFSDKLRGKIVSVLDDGDMLDNLAINLCGGNADDIFEDSLESSCQNIIDKVDECIKCIKKELKID